MEFFGDERSHMLSKLDAKQKFRQVPVAEETKPLLAYTSAMGQFEYNFMPIGTKNAIQTFQQRIEQLLAGLLWIDAMVYVDNCYVKSKDDVQEHCRQLRTVLQKYQDFNVKLRPSKCRFGY